MDWEELRNIVAWIVVALAAVFIAWAPVSCSMDGNAKIAQAIQAGANPIDAKCAYSSQGDTAACAIRAAMSGDKAK